MSEFTDFDDLAMLTGGDLKAVFKHVAADQVVAALWGSSAGLRGMLLRRLPRAYAEPLAERIDATEGLTFQQVKAAQSTIVRVMCELGRNGVIAFDAPEDMVA